MAKLIIEDRDFTKSILEAKTESQAKKLTRMIQEELYYRMDLARRDGHNKGVSELQREIKSMLDIRDPDN